MRKQDWAPKQMLLMHIRFKVNHTINNAHNVYVLTIMNLEQISWDPIHNDCEWDPMIKTSYIICTSIFNFL